MINRITHGDRMRGLVAYLFRNGPDGRPSVAGRASVEVHINPMPSPRPPASTSLSVGNSPPPRTVIWPPSSTPPGPCMISTPRRVRVAPLVGQRSR